MPPPAFISYAREDAAFALRLAADLKARGANVWLDQLDIEPGLPWEREVQRALAACNHMLIILTPTSVEKDNVMDEIDYALKKEKRIVPIYYRDCEVPFRIGRLNQIDMRLDYESGLRALIRGLGAGEGATPPVDPGAGPVAGETREHPKDGLSYVWIPSGKFTRGCSRDDGGCYPNESPKHEVTITRGFWLGQTPVTEVAWARFLEATRKGARTLRSELPVVNLSWEDVREYCKWAGLRLPTEAEWEYSARAGNTEARYGKPEDIAWYWWNSGGRRCPVRGKQANGWKLYDMLGNVWELVSDWYGNYEKADAVDPKGPLNGEFRVLRGGSWRNGSRIIRASYRYRIKQGSRDSNIGLRCVWELR
jgi:formylglycine-generating enzyme required for sulfatase activity